MKPTLADLFRGREFRPTEEQAAAICADLSEPLLVVAGAGSGKTTLMAARVAWAVSQAGVRPDQVLGLTFTVKAAAELAGRVRDFLRIVSGSESDEPMGEPAVSTLHSFAHQLVSEHALRLGLEPGIANLDDADLVRLAYDVTVRSRLDLSIVGRGPASVAKSLVTLDGQLVEHGVEPGSLRAHDLQMIAEVEELDRTTKSVRKLADAARARVELSHLVEEFRAAKIGRGAADFTDLMRHCHDLLREHPEVGEFLRNRYRLVLLDEYQDTSFVQTQILSLAFTRGHPVTAVGDPLQAIYGWRGGSPESIEAFPRLFSRTDGMPARSLTLSVSQRSPRQVLEAANLIAEPLRSRHPSAVVLRPASRSDDFVAGVADIDRPAVEVAMFRTRQDEAGWVAEQVRSALSEGVDPDSIAVLTRTKKDGRAMVDVLVEHGVSACFTVAGDLLTQRPVLDVLNVMQAAFDPSDNRAVLRLLRGPRWRIGWRDLAVLGDRADCLARTAVRATRDHGTPTRLKYRQALARVIEQVDSVELPSLAEAAADPGQSDRFALSTEARKRLSEFTAELVAVRAMRDLPLPDLVTEVARTIGLDVELEVECRRHPPAALAHKAMLRQFDDFVSRFQGTNGVAGIRGFLGWVETVRRLDGRVKAEVPRRPGSVNVLTMHAAKGLEWDQVFVPFMCTGVFPTARSRSTSVKSPAELPDKLRSDRHVLPVLSALDNKSLKQYDDDCKASHELDERQLAYVATTRARKRLVASGHWWGPTQMKPRGPSTILLALRDAAGEPGRAPWADPPEEGATNPTLEAPSVLDDAALTGAELVDSDLPDTDLSDPDLSDPDLSDADLSEADRRRVEAWRAAFDRLEREAASPPSGFPPPVSDAQGPDMWSASSAVSLMRDPTGYLGDLRRPMPQRPSPAARRGTAFHQWVQDYYGRPTLFEESDEFPPDGQPPGGQPSSGPEHDLAELKRGFEECGYSERRPLAVEWPFSVVIGGRVFTGQIDAIFQEGDTYQVVDWKTNASMDADPLQLAVYRLAWASSRSVDPHQVVGVFAYVRLGEVEVFPDLPVSPEISERLAHALVSAEVP